MLKSLLIKNYVLIRHLEMTPSPALNIITGETGAGKSIMLGAIGLLLGNRADTKVLFKEDEKCIIEGVFDIKKSGLKDFFEKEDIEFSEECIIRREISPGSKSRAFINDTPVTLEQLRVLSTELLDIHSQHETLQLGNSLFQLNLIDAYAGNKEKVKEYSLLYKKLISLRDQIKEVKSAIAENKKQEEFNQYLFKELEEAELKSGEQEKLEQDLKLLENQEEIREKLTGITNYLSGDQSSVVSSLQTATKLAEQLAGLNPAYTELTGRLKSSMIELKDIASEFENESGEGLEVSLNKEEIEDRLGKIYSLLKKHQTKDIEDLLIIREELSTKLQDNSDLENKLEQLVLEEEKLLKSVTQEANVLSAARDKVKDKIRKELKELLADVGMPDCNIEIRQEEVGLNNYGKDKISVLFSANKGIAPVELKNAASGGEFSRLMLCIKYILAGKTQLATIIFDEIDTGISGEIAIKVGKMMKKISSGHQVISISHLPQIAAMGNYHYFVYKDEFAGRSTSNMKVLSEKERIQEIAQMIGGLKPSENAIKNAKELLETAG